MQKKSFIFSFLLHGLLLLFLFLDLSFFNRYEKRISKPVPLIVDLSKVQIGSKTNLPPMPQQAKKPAPVKSGPVAQQPKKVTKTAATQVKMPEVPAVKPIQAQPIKKAVKAVAKPLPKKQPVAKPSAPKATDSGLGDLLTSVNKLKKKPTPTATNTLESVEETQQVNQGIQGGTQGSFTQVLSISEVDFIASKLRECWNVPAGAEGIDTIVVEVLVKVARDGQVQKVKTNNHISHVAFKTVSESAERAIHICAAKGEDSPFKILANKAPDSYGEWKELLLRFNPLDGGIY